MTNKSAQCWICGNPANSGEHMIKASDLRAMFGGTLKQPLYFHTDNIKNLKLQSIKADRLKFSHVICHACNSTRTQKHDMAWEHFSDYTRKLTFQVGDTLRLNKIFPYNSKHHMRWVQLYFVKFFGCAITEYNVPIDTQSFAEAINQDKLHPNIYLAFGPKPSDVQTKMAGVSDMQVWKNGQDVLFAVWFLFLDHITVSVMYAKEGHITEGTKGGWHPRQSPNRIRMFDVDLYL